MKLDGFPNEPYRVSNKIFLRSLVYEESSVIYFTFSEPTVKKEKKKNTTIGSVHSLLHASLILQLFSPQLASGNTINENVEQILFNLITYNHHVRRGLNLPLHIWYPPPLAGVSCGQTRAFNLPSRHSCRIKRPSSELLWLKSISSWSCLFVILTFILKQLLDDSSGCTALFLPNKFPINISDFLNLSA